MNEPLENLMVKARRGVLRADERRSLELGLNASLEATLLYQAGRGFDEEPVVKTGDETFLDGVAAEAALRFGRSPRSVRRRAPAVAVAIWVASGMAAAGTVGFTYHAARSLSVDRSRLATAPPQPTAPKASTQTAVVTGEILPQVAPSAGQGDSKQASRPAPRSLALPLRQSAQSLFLLANEARSDGRVTDAVRDYQRVQQEFPKSREAELATMSLGLLEMQQGNAPAAWTHFHRARLTHPSPEALWGEAQALRQLGRVDEERNLLEDLLSQYPGSAYASAASKRLGAQD